MILLDSKPARQGGTCCASGRTSFSAASHCSKSPHQRKTNPIGLSFSPRRRLSSSLTSTSTRSGEKSCGCNPTVQKVPRDQGLPNRQYLGVRTKRLSTLLQGDDCWRFLLPPVHFSWLLSSAGSYSQIISFPWPEVHKQRGSFYKVLLCCGTRPQHFDTDNGP